MLGGGEVSVQIRRTGKDRIEKISGPAVLILYAADRIATAHIIITFEKPAAAVVKAAGSGFCGSVSGGRPPDSIRVTKFREGA
jgi:hypothetical protein